MKGATQVWHRIIDGEVHEVFGRVAYVEGATNLTVFHKGGTWFTNKKILRNFRNSEFSILTENWKEGFYLEYRNETAA